MALNPVALSAGLRAGWLPTEGGSLPGSAAESADAFAGEVSAWFAAATAGPFPCATATARRPQLASAATGALSAGAPPLAGAMLADALAGYLTGQAFGPGIANAPLGATAAQVALAAVFSDLAADTGDRADRLAAATWALALTTVVVFPPVVSPPVPVT